MGGRGDSLVDSFLYTFEMRRTLLHLYSVYTVYPIEFRCSRQESGISERSSVYFAFMWSPMRTRWSYIVDGRGGETRWLVRCSEAESAASAGQLKLLPDVNRNDGPQKTWQTKTFRCVYWFGCKHTLKIYSALVHPHIHTVEHITSSYTTFTPYSPYRSNSTAGKVCTRSPHLNLQRLNLWPTAQRWRSYI